MSEQRDIDLINELLANDRELPWLEFKKDNIDKIVIGKLCSALSNGARSDECDFGYLLWGIDDASHQVVGTTFDPEIEKVNNQGLQIWLAQQLNGFETIIDYINNILPINEHIGHAFREEHPLFPKRAIRELVANALIHQDMTITGVGPQIELFTDRIEISNPGKSLVKLERMIDLPPRSRNEMLASLMRRMGLCEEQGSGLDKVIAEVELYQLPPPLFRESDSAIQAILYGPRSFAHMTSDERVRACYQHSVLMFLAGHRMKNSSLSARFGIKLGNEAQTSKVLTQALKSGAIRLADNESPRAGYVPFWV